MKTKNLLLSCIFSIICVNLTHAYPPLSPYAYCAADPVNIVDPDGKDIWEIDRYGTVIKRMADRTQDAFYMVENINGDWQRSGQYIVFEYGTISAQRRVNVTASYVNGETKTKTLTIFEVKGDDNASRLFEFLANPGVTTDVEWGHVKIGTKTSQRNLLGTLNECSGSGINDYAWKTDYTIRESNHNHPSGIGDPSQSDVEHAAQVQTKFPNATFNIYTCNSPYYSPYNRNTQIKEETAIPKL
ncbi:JAB-like toxin 1 domain-containing protein [uncultured Alistipes sp.]|uniref:JAB-like toxin 1 domain-containing protein n=1 Tax=uncultured Alistipes sp. TaxID=538949 RepID=UPI0026297B68|nr:JAB-like toxin 1 domain-containing protein [uncultured Alistipes sp.]